ncbi:MAG TPA: DinB family protein [Thermoanaerobaculia bacterium]|nr:DinB family protein [Thermoanaerobaculia bacterium]
MNDDALTVLLDALRTRITRVFPAQVRAAVEPLTDEQIWWRPNETSNSIGNLILHLAGSLDHYLNRNLGALDFTRDRAAEFAERRELPKAELLARFDAMVANAERTFDMLTPQRLTEPSPEPKMYSIALEDVLNAAMHVANHAGQIVWIAKMLREGAVDEVWIRTHRKLGAWKPAE